LSASGKDDIEEEMSSDKFNNDKNVADGEKN
jgi:hypothetical protein